LPWVNGRESVFSIGGYFMLKPRILLVYPYIEDFAAYDHFAKPLGLWMVAGMLKDVADVSYINALDRSLPLPGIRHKPDGTGHFFQQVIETPPQLLDIPRRWKRYGMPEEMFLARLRACEKPDWVFVSSGMTYWYRGLQYTIALIRQVFPDVRIVVGGIYASLLPQHAKAIPGVDVVVPFQQPAKVADFLTRLMGISFSQTSFVPDYHIAGEYAYAPLLLALGCVFRCHYCASPFLSSFQELDMEGVLKAFDFLYQEKGVRHFAFYDDALLVDARRRLWRLMEHVLKHSYECFFHTPNGLHIRFLDQETSDMMKKSGFVDVRLSLESIDEDFQKDHGQKAARDDFLRAMEMLTRSGFEPHQIRVYTLVNVPGQSLASVEKTMEFIFCSGATPMLAYYSPIPGTPDFERAVCHLDLSDPLFHNNTVYLYRSGIDVDHVQYLHSLEVDYRHRVARH